MPAIKTRVGLSVVFVAIVILWSWIGYELLSSDRWKYLPGSVSLLCFASIFVYDYFWGRGGHGQLLIGCVLICCGVLGLLPVFMIVGNSTFPVILVLASGVIICYFGTIFLVPYTLWFVWRKRTRP